MARGARDRRIISQTLNMQIFSVMEATIAVMGIIVLQETI